MSSRNFTMRGIKTWVRSGSTFTSVANPRRKICKWPPFCRRVWPPISIASLNPLHSKTSRPKPTPNKTLRSGFLRTGMKQYPMPRHRIENTLRVRLHLMRMLVSCMIAFPVCLGRMTWRKCCGRWGLLALCSKIYLTFWPRMKNKFFQTKRKRRIGRKMKTGR